MEIKIGEKVFGDLQYDLYPKLVKVRQNFESVREDHIEKRIEKEIMKERRSHRARTDGIVRVLWHHRRIYGCGNSFYYAP